MSKPPNLRTGDACVACVYGRVTHALIDCVKYPKTVVDLTDICDDYEEREQ